MRLRARSQQEFGYEADGEAAAFKSEWARLNGFGIYADSIRKLYSVAVIGIRTQCDFEIW